MKKMNTLNGLQGFLRLWASQTVSALGTAMTEYALVIWVYGQRGTASSVTLLTLCTFLPTILFRFAGGVLADHWDKRRVMLAADLAAACGTLAVLILHQMSALRVWHLYLINALLSLMNAVQAPAAFVATSLLVPQEHYVRVGGLQGFSGAAVSILAPALGSVLLGVGGLSTVLACDLASFAVAFVTLLFFIRIPNPERQAEANETPILRSCLDGLRFLRSHAAMLRVTLFMTAVNFLAKLGGDGMLAPFVLSRTENDQRALAAVQSCVAVGLLVGGLLATAMKPARRKERLVYAACALIFVGDVVEGLSPRPWVWCAAVLFTYLVAAVMNANLTAFMREQVPLEMQGRVFAAKDTLQNGAIPLGLLLGGVLADGVFGPLMAGAPPALAKVFGAGNGAGIALMFAVVGMTGIGLSLWRLKGCMKR